MALGRAAALLASMGAFIGELGRDAELDAPQRMAAKMEKEAVEEGSTKVSSKLPSEDRRECNILGRRRETHQKEASTESHRAAGKPPVAPYPTASQWGCKRLTPERAYALGVLAALRLTPLTFAS